jgi:mannose-6-phosphate isomerase-like protein (cupin superfamily)
MAQIILEPGEEFEHQHTVESTTSLVEGRVHVVYGDISRELVSGEAIDIPADTPHIFTNLGSAPALLNCIHKPTGFPRT